MARQGGGLKVAHLAGPGFQNKFDGKYVLKDIFEDENQNFEEWPRRKQRGTG